MGEVSWQDKKKLVILLSTAELPWEPNTNVLHRIPNLRGQLIVLLSPMHRQYVVYMRGVDVTDQLRGNYSSQLRCHKWWVKLFSFVVDQSLVNGYVTWVKDMEELGLKVMPHLAFKIAVGKHLIQEAINSCQRSKQPRAPTPRHPPRTHTHYHSKLKRICVVCRHPQQWYCAGYRNKWICREECYHIHHDAMNKRKCWSLTHVLYVLVCSRVCTKLETRLIRLFIIGTSI